MGCQTSVVIQNLLCELVLTSLRLFVACSFSCHRSGAFDSLDKAFCVLKLDTDSSDFKLKAAEEECESGYLIRRVDLIVSPPDQYPFAMVSWTGSKVRR